MNTVLTSRAAILDELTRRLDPAGRRRPRNPDWLEQLQPIECADGLKMSVQASETHYCMPRDNRGPWYQVEIGFPSRKVDEIMEWAEEPGKPTGTVYCYVPLSAVVDAIVAAGGLEGGAS